MIWLPLFCEGVNTGFVGFDAVKQKKVFTEQEINLLKVLAEITSNSLAKQKKETNIRYISFHDQLTGLYNRHFLEEEMKRLDTQRQLPISIIMADINGLKLVNDTYGHSTGDEMIKTAANILERVCRKEDIIARWGGDEFVILSPQTTEKTALEICKRIHDKYSKTYVKDVPISISSGTASKNHTDNDLKEVLKEAEDNMYKKKLTESRSGKSGVLKALLKTLEEKSYEKEAHPRRMQNLALKIGKRIGISDSELSRLGLVITLHDVGKIIVPEEILTKKSTLTEDEWEIIKKHPETGYRIARSTEDFAHVAEDILSHHEHWDGTGYPRGLKGEEIPLLARITAIADAYEVMTNGRPYKKTMSHEEVVAELKRCAGNQFDPKLMETFLSVLKRERKSTGDGERPGR